MEDSSVTKRSKDLGQRSSTPASHATKHRIRRNSRSKHARASNRVPTKSHTFLYSTEKDLTIFIKFPKLPLELRTIIWLLTLTPRIIEIRLSHSKGFYTTASLPIILSVSQESREVGLKRYALCFGSAWYSPLTRFSFSLDTLYFSSHMTPHARLFFSSLRDFEIKSLQAIALDEDIFSADTHNEAEYDRSRGICKSLEKMPNLSILLDVVENSCLDVWFDYFTTRQLLHKSRRNADGSNPSPITFHSSIPPSLQIGFKRQDVTFSKVQDLGAQDFWISGKGGKLGYKLPNPETVLGIREDFVEWLVGCDELDGLDEMKGGKSVQKTDKEVIMARKANGWM